MAVHLSQSNNSLPAEDRHDQLGNRTESTDSESGTLFNQFERWAPLVASIILIALLWSSYGRTLSSYFLADDFGEVAYATLIAKGRLDLLWLNWIGNYMQIPSMAVYRPWLMVTLVTDNLLWHANATGYYLTNLLYVSGDTLLLFALCKEMANGWKPWRGNVFAFFAAALFAVSPLHCESTSWVVGRVDTACCFYYLTSLLLFIISRKPRHEKNRVPLVAASSLAFVLAMLVKEMAIGLPVLVTGIAFLFPNGFDDSGRNGKKNLGQRVVLALKESAVYWGITVAYFIVRYLALGTLLGGYTGGIGSAQASSALNNWLQLDIYRRVAFPLAYDLYGLTSGAGQTLLLTYTGVLTIAAVRLFSRNLPWRLLALLIVWTATTLAAIYKLWSLGLNLEGSRFLFFLTVPLSLTLPLLMLAPGKEDDKSKNLPLNLIGGGCLTILLITLFRISTTTDISWVHAGKEVKACQQSALQIANSLPEQHQVIALGIPKSHIAAHMIYNGDTFRTMLRPPFAEHDVASKFLTFDPIMFGNDQFINASRFKTTLQQKNIEGIRIWNRASKQWQAIALAQVSPSSEDRDLGLNIGNQQTQIYTQNHARVVPLGDGVLFQTIAEGDGLRFSNLQLDPLAYDYLELKIRGGDQPFSKLNFKAQWDTAFEIAGSKTGEAAAALDTKDLKHKIATVRIPLSRYWRWYSTNKIDQLVLVLPAGASNLEILSAKLRSDQHLRPQLTVVDTKDDGTGIYTLDRKKKLHYDASNVTGASRILVETTPPNFFFDMFDGPNIADSLYTTYKITGTQDFLGLGEDICPAGGYSQIRVRALNESGAPIGEYSDPITVLIH